MPRRTIRTLVDRGELDGTFVAVCLDHYVVAQGDSPEDALGNLQLMLAGYLCLGIENQSDDPLRELAKAPKRFWKEFDSDSGRQEEVVLPALQIEFRSVFMRMLAHVYRWLIAAYSRWLKESNLSESRIVCHYPG